MRYKTALTSNGTVHCSHNAQSFPHTHKTQFLPHF